MIPISKNNNGTASAVDGDGLTITYVPGKDYYMVETPGPRKSICKIPSDLLDALYNAAWEIKDTPNEDGLYYCPSHDYEQSSPCPECQVNKLK